MSMPSPADNAKIALVINAPKQLGILVAAALASIWLAYSGPRQGAIPGLLPFFLVVIALAPFLVNLLALATPGSGVRYAAIFGIAWFGINPANSPTLAQPDSWRILFAVLGLIAGLFLYQWCPELRSWAVFLIPVVGAAFCHRVTLAFGPLLFAYIFLFEEDARWFAIPASLLRCLPGVLASLLALRLPPAPAMPWDLKIAQAARTALGFLSSWNASGAPGQDASAVAVAVLLAVACYTILFRHTRALSFGLWWFLILILIVPGEPLPASIGLAIAGASIVARAVTLVPRQELRLVAAGCLCLLLLGGAGIAERNVQAFVNPTPLQSTVSRAPTLTAPTQAPQALTQAPQALTQAPQAPPSAPPTPPALGDRIVVPVTPEGAARLVEVSLSLYRLGRFQESIGAAQAALQIDPNSAPAYNNIAAANSELHRWDAAIEAAQQALRLRPDFTLARNNLNWALEQKRQGR